MNIINIHCIPGTRERQAGEVTPVKVEHSRSNKNDDTKHGAKLAIDMNFGTVSSTTSASEGIPWLKVILDRVRCIKEVLRYQRQKNDNGHLYQTWTCLENNCNNCDGKNCEYFALKVSTEEAGAASDFPSFSDCKHGNIVKLERTKGDPMFVSEIAVIEIQGNVDCYLFATLKM